LNFLGAEFDPKHHSLVKALQKLEKLLHPKRKEGLSYVPPFVTKYAVDESIESYWNRVVSSPSPPHPAPLASCYLERLD
jgi:hypothetical protein